MITQLVFFIGPFPPPVHGFSEINRRMLLVLRSRYQVNVFNMAPPLNLFKIIFIWLRFFLAILKSKPEAVYVALSGGYRQWIDLSFLLLARVRGVPIFVHHHSFSYLNKWQLSAFILFGLLRGGTKHIALCECMGDKLIKKFGINLVDVRVLSNGAFLEDIEKPKPVKNLLGPLRIGFLSNITEEKGIFEFFTVLSRSAKNNFLLEGLIAGPIDPSIKTSFHASLAANKNIKYIGAVYGLEKKAFFSNIDVLFFPTRYANEAEPVTILEAMGHGIPVIAFARGCIEGMIPTKAGAVFPYSDFFIKQTIEALQPWAENPAQLATARLIARAAFEAGLVSNKVALESLVAEIGGRIMIKPVSA